MNIGKNTFKPWHVLQEQGTVFTVSELPWYRKANIQLFPEFLNDMSLKRLE